MYAVHTSGACRGQKKASDRLGLQLPRELSAGIQGMEFNLGPLQE